ncbi:hypothetical protein BKA62DRAFT_771642 [Auriculariales sp. MPI-PUGE-AT-0066]|nr:hypothetical protein BKA62DRAFT_771642 [Auriculariales sp. MPI-PUGE-AT-0066]
MSSFEDGYARTLSALQRPGNTAPATVLSSLSYYLAHIALPHPTTLTRAAVLSPLHTDVNRTGPLLALADTFSGATRLRVKLGDESPRGLFSRSAHSDLALWLRAVLEGTTSAPELVKIAILGGVLSALHDLTRQHGRAVGQIENELVVAYAAALGGLDADNTTTTRVFGAYYLQYVSDRKLAALDLPVLVAFAIDALETVYGPSGFTSYLSGVEEEEGVILVPSTSILAQSIERTSSDLQYKVLPSLARLVARSVIILAEHDSRRLARLMDDVSRKLEALCMSVETSWSASPLAAASSETQLQPATRPIATSIWTAFKTLLFSIALIQQSILTVLVYDGGSAAPALGAIALRSFSSLAFVLAQFGGIAAPGGVPELRRAAFNALDVVASDGAESDVLVRALVQDLQNSSLPHSHPVWHAKAAYAFACIEQLVPVLPDTCLRQVVVPVCTPHLRDASNRETFEAAHSTVLAVFAWTAQRIERGDDEADVYGRELIPGYLQILLETNGADGNDEGLRGPQLRLAIAAAARATMHEPALALLLIDDVLALQSGGASSATADNKSKAKFRRGLMLAALLPAVQPRLLQKVLVALEETATSEELSGDDAAELGKAVYEEISERASDAARAILVRWWMAHEELFRGHGAESASQDVSSTL